MFITRTEPPVGHGRPGFWLAVAFLTATISVAGSVRAQNYPWCANFHDGAGTNCGFSTEAQCRETVMGSGGFCDRNVQYKPVAMAAPAPTRKHRPHSSARR